MGKEGIAIVTRALRADDVSEDDAPKAAAFLLDGFSFFYENPKSTVSLYRFINLFINNCSYISPARQRRVSRKSRCICARSSHEKNFRL